MPESLPIPIIRSKLYQPRSARDLINRDRLLQAAPSDIGGTVTVVSAPAGYGKSTFVSQRVEALAWPSAWLSLDSGESDLRQFVSYLVASLRTAVADCCNKTVEILQTVAPQSAEEFAIVLCNDLDLIDEPVVLVLDDYHQISGSDVHDLVEVIIERPPRNLHIVIVTRRDPPLSLQTLRAKGVLDEFRVQQLAFTVEETRKFIHQDLGDEISEQVITRLQESTEGWPAGLRLVTLAMRGSDGADEFVKRIPTDIQLPSANSIS